MFKRGNQTEFLGLEDCRRVVFYTQPVIRLRKQCARGGMADAHVLGQDALRPLRVSGDERERLLLAGRQQTFHALREQVRNLLAVAGAAIHHDHYHRFQAFIEGSVILQNITPDAGLDERPNQAGFSHLRNDDNRQAGVALLQSGDNVNHRIKGRVVSRSGRPHVEQQYVGGRTRQQRFKFSAVMNNANDFYLRQPAQMQAIAFDHSHMVIQDGDPDFDRTGRFRKCHRDSIARMGERRKI